MVESHHLGKGEKSDAESAVAVGDVVARVLHCVIHHVVVLSTRTLRRPAEADGVDRGEEAGLVSPPAAALRVNAVLTKLNLDGHELDLPKLRGSTDPVTSLDLSGKVLGPASAIVIASLMVGNEVLTELHLNNNSIGIDGAKALASALRVNAVLKVIDLRLNNLGDEGKGVIRDAVSGREGFKLKM